MCSPDAAALADLDRHRAAHDIARSQILGIGCVALHEALTLGVGEITALAARALGDQAAGPIDAGRMKLHELHILQRQSGTQCHATAIARAGVRRSAGELGASVTAGGEDRGLGAEAMQLAGRPGRG